MNRSRLTVLGPLAVLLALALVGCGGGETPEPPPEPTPAPAPEPPPTQDLDLEPGTISIGEQNLDASIATDNLLPPNAFGTLDAFSASVGTVSANLTAIKLTTTGSDGNSHWIKIEKAADGTVSWSTDGGAVTAYDVATNNNDCNLMSSNLAALIASGAALDYTWQGVAINNAPSSFGSDMSISLQITPPANSPCPPSGP